MARKSEIPTVPSPSRSKTGSFEPHAASRPSRSRMSTVWGGVPELVKWVLSYGL